MRHFTPILLLALVIVLSQASLLCAQRSSAVTRAYTQPPPAMEAFSINRTDMAYAQVAMLAAQAEMVKATAMAIESRGKAAESFARAAESEEKAQSAHYDNQVKKGLAYYERKKVRDNYLAAHAKKPAPRPAQTPPSSGATAKRLERHQFDPLRGVIRWPAPFEGEEFSEHRAQLDGLFVRRSPADSGPGSRFYRLVQDATENMRSLLKAQIREMPAAEYLAARKFLDGLSAEAQVPPRIEGLAAR